MRAVRKFVQNAFDSTSFAVKYLLAGTFIGTGIYNAASVLYAFQTMSPSPTSTGTLDTNNDSKGSPALTTAAGQTFDRSTMSLQAIKNNFTTVLSDTSTLKTTTSSILTRVNGEACVNWVTTASSSCPAGWTYKTQSTFTLVTGCSTSVATQKGQICNGVVTAVQPCWGQAPY